MRTSETRTEGVARELLAIRGWKPSRPPKGNLLWKNEYRDYPDLASAFAGRGKQGHGGDAYPDFLLLDPETLRPLIVGETKAEDSDISKAIKEARDYSAGLIDRGLSVLAAGVAGDDSGNIAVQVDKWAPTGWRKIEYRSRPIQWLPTPEEARNLLLDEALFDLQPRVPAPEILARRGDEMNRILRECKIKDEFRPAIMGAFMLALWQSKGNIRLDPSHILLDINAECKEAFEKAGKPELAESLVVPVENSKLASRSQHIVYILKLLNITTLTSEHDYLGQLYEQFFRFTGGNTIGKYFTPRHITQFMADLCNVSQSDFVVDPACGTGGFLISALHRMLEGQHLTQTELNSMVKKHLRGYETEPITAALCVANMILRGDGKTGIVKGDCFTDASYPEGQGTVVLGNPPFPHAKTDEPAEKFLDRGLEALIPARGKLAMIVPGSLLVKGAKRKWRAKTLKKNSLEAVITLPAELFQPYAASTTAIVILERGVPHPPDKKTFFAHIENDGYRLKKNTRILQPGSQIGPALSHYHSYSSSPGFCTWATLKRPVDSAEWAPGAYIEATAHDLASLRCEADWLIRSLVAFHAQYAPQLQVFLDYLKRDDTPIPRPYREVSNRVPKNFGTSRGTLGGMFEIAYGQKELHNKENLATGPALVISSSGTNNGCYGFFDFDRLIKSPFVTVPSTGSIGEAFVQLWPCGVTDDCLILTPKDGTDFEDLFIAAAVLRLERWRFNYGRKVTPSRIAHMKVDRDLILKEHIRVSFGNAHVLMRDVQAALEPAKIDVSIGQRISELADQWRRETGHLSSIERKAMHPAYQEIIAIGSKGVPHVLRELKEHGGHWFWALRYMTGVDLGEDCQSVGELREHWLDWGRKHNYAGL